MTTGKEASNTVVEEKWATSFLFGLVPARLDVSDECPTGIASAEREMSFLNMLVSGLTFNIYSPQSVTVTCAAEGAMSAATQTPVGMKFTLSQDATKAEIQNVLSTVAIHSSATQRPAQVRVTKK